MKSGRSSNQGSAAFNLWKKFEWMSRRLRFIDEATIQDWIDAMNSVCSLMHKAAKNTEVYNDSWRPWNGMSQIGKLSPTSLNAVDSSEVEDVNISRFKKTYYANSYLGKTSVDVNRTSVVASTKREIAAVSNDIDMKSTPSLRPDSPRFLRGKEKSTWCHHKCNWLNFPKIVLPQESGRHQS